MSPWLSPFTPLKCFYEARIRGAKGEPYGRARPFSRWVLQNLSDSLAWPQKINPVARVQNRHKPTNGAGRLRVYLSFRVQGGVVGGAGHFGAATATRTYCRHKAVRQSHHPKYNDPKHADNSQKGQ